MMARGPRIPEKRNFFRKIEEVFVSLIKAPDVTRQSTKLWSMRLTLAFLFVIWQIHP